MTKPTLITIDGRTQSITAWAHELGINQTKISRRIQRGWDPVEAVKAEGRVVKSDTFERKANDRMIGRRFGRLTVVSSAGVSQIEKRIWNCSCDCGGLNVVTTGDLTSGHTRSCGCLQAEKQASGNPKHGGRYSKAYSSWVNMKGRCDNPDLPQYKDWGGRGITYDPRWADFENFYADMGDPPDRTTLDRIDVNGNYCKQNCRWADRATQRRNTRGRQSKDDRYRLRLITIDGRIQCLQDWCTEYGITMSSVWKRERAGMTVVEALTKPKTNWNGR